MYGDLWRILEPVLGKGGLGFRLHEANALLYKLGDSAFIMPHHDSHHFFCERLTLLIELTQGKPGQTVHFRIGSRTLRIPDSDAGRQLVTLITSDAMHSHFAYVGPEAERRSIALFLYLDVMGDDLEELQRDAKPGDYPDPSVVALHDALVRLRLRDETTVPLEEGDAEVIAAVEQKKKKEKPEDVTQQSGASGESEVPQSVELRPLCCGTIGAAEARKRARALDEVTVNLYNDDEQETAAARSKAGDLATSRWVPVNDDPRSTDLEFRKVARYAEGSEEEAEVRDAAELRAAEKDGHYLPGDAEPHPLSSLS